MQTNFTTDTVTRWLATKPAGCLSIAMTGDSLTIRALPANVPAKRTNARAAARIELAIKRAMVADNIVKALPNGDRTFCVPEPAARAEFTKLRATLGLAPGKASRADWRRGLSSAIAAGAVEKIDGYLRPSWAPTSTMKAN